mmetsp:Transcript_34314/g.90643  ORF Transcript_34314/g.90643 Transcript_34314/m.90643 type:complete len:311 (+) Transcript_34314:1707-2639(+)
MLLLGSDCASGSKGGGMVAHALETMLELSSLDLSCNTLGAEGACHLSPTLGRLSALTALNISRNELGTEGAKALAAGLQQLGAITSLDISHNQMGDEGAVELSRALAGHSNLFSLNIRSNGMGEAGWLAVAEAVTALPGLAVVNEWDGYWPLGAGLACKLEARAMLKTHDVGAPLVAAVLGRSAEKLVHLELSANGLGDLGVTHLCRPLSALTRLTFLDLRSNRIADEGAKALAGALVRMCNITGLNLSHNPLARGDCFAPLLPALATMTALRELVLHDGLDGLCAQGMQERIAAAAPATARLVLSSTQG